jgi:hypothetical protein
MRRKASKAIGLRALVCLVQVVEFTARMGKAGQLDTGVALPVADEQRFVVGIVVSAKDGANAANAGAMCVPHQMPRPGSQELAGVLAAAPRPVIEDDDARPVAGQVIAAVDPEISFFGFPATGVELRHWGLVAL